MRLAMWLLLALVPLLGAGAGALAWADGKASDRIPRGAVIGGVAVGNLTQEQALERLEQRIGDPARRPVTVKLDGRTVRLSAKRAGVSLDLRTAVRKAYESGRTGSFAQRGWRALRKHELASSQTVQVTVDRKKIDRFVASLASRVAQAPVDAQLELSVERVAVTPGASGRRLGGQASLGKRIRTAFTRPGAERQLNARTVEVPPNVTEDALWEANRTVVTVSHKAKQATVFDHGKIVKRYHVAVGDPKYPTPNGRFVVQSMQKDPVWNVPQSDWAGDLAGKTIPGGDPKNPLIARWIGFDGSVGFHGTRDLASLGRAASHGCVRMDPKDVKDLYTRVAIGTTVLVGA